MTCHFNQILKLTLDTQSTLWCTFYKNRKLDDFFLFLTEHFYTVVTLLLRCLSKFVEYKSVLDPQKSKNNLISRPDCFFPSKLSTIFIMSYFDFLMRTITCNFKPPVKLIHLNMVDVAGSSWGSVYCTGNKGETGCSLRQLLSLQ